MATEENGRAVYARPGWSADKLVMPGAVRTKSLQGLEALLAERASKVLATLAVYSITPLFG